MNYNFPVIETIEDVLPHIEGNDEFIVIKKGDYTVIDYIVQGPHTFGCPYKDREDISEANGKFEKFDLGHITKRECRGLIFDKEGKLISRAFHKFFNYGEKPFEQKFMGLPSEVLEKLDGSMIRPLIIDGDIRLATRKGITDVAMQAETFAAGKENYITFISAMDAVKLTPIFEWCSRNNQIVLDYPEENLVLLAIRGLNSGEYKTYAEMENLARQFNIPVVQSYSLKDEPLEAAVTRVKNMQNKEGHVFVFPNGHRLKAKADWYVTLHRAKDAIGREKDLIKAYLTTGVDDIIPILPEAFKQEVCGFLAKMTEELVTTCQRIDGMFVRLVEKMPDSFTRKDFALEVLKLDPKYKSIMFSLLPGTPCMEVLIPILLNACQSNKKLDEFRWVIGGIRFKEKGIV